MPFLFGVGTHKITQKEESRIQQLLKKYHPDVSFLYITEPGNKHRFWFETKNRGQPFDNVLARSVMERVGQIKKSK